MLARIGQEGPRRDIGLLPSARGRSALLDRLISGAGAVTDGADRLVRVLARGGGTDLLNHRPGSVLVVVLLVAASIGFGLVAAEANDNPTPRLMAPAEIAAADDLGRRVYTTIDGYVSDAYVETYADDNSNGSQDSGEDGEAWYYFLLDADSPTGVTVRTTRPPSEMMRYEVTGVIVRDPVYLAEDVAAFPRVSGHLGVPMTLEEAVLIDTTVSPAGEPVALDLREPLPSDGTHVSLTGEIMGYVDVCDVDSDGDGTCAGDEIVAYDVYLGDRASGRAITFYDESLPRIGPLEFTGMLRRDPGSITEARTADRLDYASLGITTSDVYLLDDEATPGSALLSAAVAVLAAGLATVIAIGLVGGYLVFRRSRRGLPSGARALDPGAAIPVRVTGVLRRPDGLVHVREAKAQLVRFTLASEASADDAAKAVDAAPTVDAAPAPYAPPALDPAPAVNAAPAVDAGPVAPADRADLVDDAPTVEAAGHVDATELVGTAVAAAPAPDAARPETTLIVERIGEPAGVALGRGELTELSSGRVMPFRGPRPALRAMAGTGPILLSFDSSDERDRAAAELIGEAGLAVQATGLATR